MKTFCLLALTFMLLGCSEKTPQDIPPKDTTPETTQTSQPTNNPQKMTEKITELTFDIEKPGQGTEAKAGDTVSVHYVGTFTDGRKFDSSRDKNQPFAFTLGQGQVIQGWDQGVQGMKVGEIRNLKVPSDLAYGPNGFPPIIPPNTPLLFEVELLEIQ